MKTILKRGAGVLLAAVLCFTTGISALADSTDADTVEGTITEEEITVSEGDKPFLSFGADLRDSEKAIVLDLLGVKESELGNYEVTTVTNKEEHHYLDDYISSDKIGNRALSSVVVMEGEKGSGINVTTKNINYCTAGMYENALTTAGLEDAEVIVAGPFEISGTAALLGAAKAYAVMTGEEVDEDKIDGAVDEIVTTGAIESSTGSADKVEGMVAYLKEQIASNNLSGDEIGAAIDEAAQKFGVELSEDDKANLTGLMDKLSGLDLNVDSLKSQAQSVYDKLSGLGLKIDTSALKTEAQGLFARIIAFIKALFNR